MQITIFGATGVTGQILVKKALAKGYDVVAYARNPSKLTITNDRLRVVEGQLHDHAAIENAIRGSGAIISVLGPKGASKGLPLSSGIKIIIRAMQSQGIRRLIAISTPSAADPEDGFDFMFRLAVMIIRRFLPDAYTEIVTTAEAIRNSDLDWTLVRLPLLSNKHQQGVPRTGYVGKHKVRFFSLSRETLADFLLSQIHDSDYIRKAPAISD